MEAMVAADAAAAAKRHTRAKLPAKAVIDPALPNGVGIQGCGRAAMNAPMADGSNCVAAMAAATQQRRQSLLAAAEFRRTQTVIAVSPAGAGKFDGMPDRDDYAAGAEGEEQYARDFEKKEKRPHK